MDAIKLLTQDHRDVEKLFKQFESAGPHAYETKRSIMERIIEALSVHATIEEQVFYPAVRSEVDGTNDEVLEALEEHHVVKWLLSELEDLAPDDERYTAKATVLIENVRHHVEEEQDDLFPKVRKALSERELDRIGDALEKAKQIAPTRPHPRSPDTPPGNLLVAPAAALVDSVTGRVKDAISDTVDRVTGNGNARSRAATAANTATRAAAAKKTAAKKTVAKKANTVARKAGAQKTAAKKTAAKKAGATKSAAKRAVKKAPAKRTARPTAKKSTAKKQATRRPPTKATAKRATSTTRKSAAAKR